MKHKNIFIVLGWLIFILSGVLLIGAFHPETVPSEKNFSVFWTGILSTASFFGLMIIKPSQETDVFVTVYQYVFLLMVIAAFSFFGVLPVIQLGIERIMSFVGSLRRIEEVMTILCSVVGLLALGYLVTKDFLRKSPSVKTT